MVFYSTDMLPNSYESDQNIAINAQDSEAAALADEQSAPPYVDQYSDYSELQQFLDRLVYNVYDLDSLERCIFNPVPAATNRTNKERLANIISHLCYNDCLNNLTLLDFNAQLSRVEKEEKRLALEELYHDRMLLRETIREAFEANPYMERRRRRRFAIGENNVRDFILGILTGRLDGLQYLSGPYYPDIEEFVPVNLRISHSLFAIVNFFRGFVMRQPNKT